MNDLMTGMIIAEGDTGIARFFCYQCGESFRADMDRVARINQGPDSRYFCLGCVDLANITRGQMGRPLLPVCRAAYHAG